jgi:hypothetical protein
VIPPTSDVDSVISILSSLLYHTKKHALLHEYTSSPEYGRGVMDATHVIYPTLDARGLSRAATSV